MNYTSLLQPTVSFETGLPPNGPGGRLLTRGSRATLQPNGSIQIGMPVLGSMAGELLHEGSVFLCIASEFLENEYPAELSRHDQDTPRWIAHPFWLSLLVSLASSGDVEANRAIENFLRDLLRLDQQCVDGRVTIPTETSLTCTAVYDCGHEAGFDLWQGELEQNRGQFHCSWEKCRCTSASVLGEFIRAGKLTEARLLPRLTGILINNNGPMSMLDILEEVPITWTSPAWVESGLRLFSKLEAEPFIGEMDWKWDGHYVVHKCSWQPGLELQNLPVPHVGFVFDGIRDLWYTWILSALGGLYTVDPESIATETPEDVLFVLMANHLVSHSKDPLEVVTESSALLGRIDMMDRKKGLLSSKNTREVMNAIMTDAYRHFVAGSVQPEDDMDIDAPHYAVALRRDIEQHLQSWTLTDLLRALEGSPTDL